jgi:Uri superfamily endonuclease
MRPSLNLEINPCVIVQQTSKFVSYQLTIVVSNPVMIAIGKLGGFNFPAGEYVYTGSANRYIDARIARHLRADKTLMWHIGYLLNVPEATVIKVVQFTESECEVNQRSKGVLLINRFGATDCAHGCGSHLKLTKKY